MDELLLQARGFAGQVFLVGSWQGELPPPASLSPGGATAMAELVLDLPAVRGGRTPKQRLRLFGGTDDADLEGLRFEAVGFLLAGAIAVGIHGDIDEDLATRLVHAAAMPDPKSLLTRGQLLGRRLFEPPPPTLPEWFEPLDDFMQRECFAGVVGAVLELGRWASSGPSSDATGITHLSATNVCPPSKLTIYGAGFGATQPADVRVYVPIAGGGCREATVTGWGDLAIEVQLPADAGAGCIGFVRGYQEYAEPQRVTGELTRCIGAAAEVWTRGFQRVGGPLVPCPPCLPGGENRIALAGRPVVNTFRFSPDRVEPGGQPVLTWNVSNATSVTITRSSTAGPLLTLLAPLPLVGSVTLPPIGGLAPVTGEYRLEAANGCGKTVRYGSFTMTARPRLSVSSIEVVQSIQTATNSVRLSAARRTAVRVFVDSGIADPFDFGDGPARVAGIDVSVLAESLDDGSIRDCGSPWSPGVAGRPLNRDLLGDSVNFDVPLAACSGNVRFRVTASLPGETGAPPVSFATGSVDVRFEAKASQELTPFLINDSLNPLPTPDMAAFMATIQGPMDAHPFAEQPAGFSINPPVPMTLGASDSLFGFLGFQRLILKFVTMIFLFPSTPVGGIRAGVVQPSSSYTNCGVALPRIGATAPGFVVQARDTSCCTHELAHCYGLQHMPACGAPWPFDGGLPLTISDPGLNVRARSILPAGTSESMTYCTPDWPSIQHWDRMFNGIPIS